MINGGKITEFGELNNKNLTFVRSIENSIPVKAYLQRAYKYG